MLWGVAEPSAVNVLDLRATGPSTAGLISAARRVVPVVVFAVLPAFVVASTLLFAAHGRFAFDFEQFHAGARDVLRGDSPYPAVGALPSREEAESLSPEEVQQAFGFPYPASTALALAPLAALPFAAAAALFTAVLLAAGAWTLWLLGVRDWRCYGVCAAWLPVLSAVRLGALTVLLAALAAAAWRYRARPVVAGLAIGGAVAAKLFLWPLLLWLLVTRRFRAAAAALGTIVVAAVPAFVLLGFGWVSDYAALLGRLSDGMEDKGYSTVALLVAAGAPESYAHVAPLALGLTVLAAVPVVARRPSGDRRAFVVAIAAALLLSPIVWLHYFALLVVPVALARRRLSLLWLLPLVFWLWPRFFDDAEGAAPQIAFGLAVAATTVLLSLRSPRVA